MTTLRRTLFVHVVATSSAIARNDETWWETYTRVPTWWFENSQWVDETVDPIGIEPTASARGIEPASSAAVVDPIGIEPTASAMPWRRSTK